MKAPRPRALCTSETGAPLTLTGESALAWCPAFWAGEKRIIGDLVHPCVHINAVREVGKARPESAGSRMAMQGGV